MVDIEDFPHRIGFEMQSRLYESALEIAHTRHSSLYTLLEHSDSLVVERLDTAGDVASAVVTLIAKSRDVKVGVGFHI